MTPLLALYCHPNDLIAGTVLLSTQTIIVPICMRYIDQPIAPIRLLSPPNARTVLLPKSNNCRAYTPATHQPNNYAYTPIINRPTGRQALYLTTIITVTNTVLLPGQTAAILAANSDLTVTTLPIVYRYFTTLPIAPH